LIKLNVGVAASKNVHGAFFWLASVLAFIVTATSVNSSDVFYLGSISLILLGVIALFVNTDPKPLSKLEKLMILTWLLYPLVTALDFWLRTGWNWSQFQEPSRFLLALPVFFMVRRFGLSKGAVKWGVFVGAVAAGLWAFYQKQELGIERAFGGTSNNVHVFGQISLLLGFMSVALFQPDWSKDWRWGFVVLMALSLGVFASLASGTKGGWISAPILCWVMVNLVRRPTYAKRLMVLAVMLTAAFLFWYFSPFIQARLGNMPLAIATYFETGQVTDGSVSIRLALWHTAILIFMDNPLFGTGIGSFNVAMFPYLDQNVVPQIIGSFDPHSQFFNALYELGIFGPIPIYAIYGAFIFQCHQSFGQNKAFSTAGLFLALGFIDFGLVEVIWNINNAGVFFTLMMVLIAGQLSHQASI
jgi:O-antigen ligase